MQCDVCKKQDATVHLTEIVDDKVKKLHLCENCAREKSEEMEAHFGLADLLSGLADLAPTSVKETEETEKISVKCPKCGFTFRDFRKIGRLGCPACYDTFKENLSPLLKKIHGSERHVGKIPSKEEVKRDTKTILANLKERLIEAIKLEEFEEAARLRDQIGEVERGK
ncbi:MAG: UvrB/UvrC motif-containing protein [Candidatus Omnitrophica bacterium]|nr:UvrB/UvrC motif-containing protein [Candidatus Omnitrophota bacterium]